MNRQSENPLRLFVDPFVAWRQLALKTGEMLVASACAGAARASAVRIAVIDQREPARQATVEPVPQAAAVRKASPSAPARPKANRTKKHKKRAKRR